MIDGNHRDDYDDRRKLSSIYLSATGVLNLSDIHSRDAAQQIDQTISDLLHLFTEYLERG